MAHLRVRSWICASQLYAPRRMAAVRGQATVVEAADIVRRLLPATAVRIAPRPAAVAPRPMAVAVVDITAAEVEAVADITAEAAVRAPEAEVKVVVTQVVAAATPVEVIARIRDEQ